MNNKRKYFILAQVSHFYHQNRALEQSLSKKSFMKTCSYQAPTSSINYHICDTYIFYLEKELEQIPHKSIKVQMLG